MGAKEACLELGVKSSNLRKLAGLPRPRELACGSVWAAEDIRDLARVRRASTRGD